MMTQTEITAAAWRQIEYIIKDVDMDEYEERDAVIEEIYAIVADNEKQARLVEADALRMVGIAGALRVPTADDFAKAEQEDRR